VLVCTTAITSASAWLFPAVPPPAVFGIAAALLALPILNRRRHVARSRALHVAVNLFGLQFPLMGVIGWALFMWIGAHRLVPAMVAVPWLFFAGGIAAAAGLLQLGFARTNLRERAETPFFSPNATWRALFSPPIMARHRDETRRHLVRCDSGHPQATTMPGRDWTVAAVGPRTRDWLQVLWHAGYGATRRGSFLHAQRLIFLVMLSYAFVMPAMGFMFALLDHRPFGFSGYLGSLAALSSADLGAVNSTAQFGSAFVSLLLFVGFTFALALGSQLRPQLAYPVSRERLARVSFSNALLQLVFALAIPSAALQFAALIGQLASGRFLPALGVPPLLLLDMAFIPILLLVASAARLPHAAARIPTFVALAAIACALAASRSLWAESVLRVPVFLGIMLTTTGALQLLWWQTRRHFRTCNLVAEAALARAFIFGVSVKINRAPLSVPGQ